MRDLECIGRTTQQFLNNTAMGIPEYGIHAIDPLLIPSFKYSFEPKAPIIHHLKNLTITGLKKLQITNFE